MPVAVKTKKVKLNLSDIISDLIQQISLRFDSFSHIDSKRILVCVGSNRTGGRGGGIYGKLVPLKFKDGAEMLKFNGRYYAMPRIIENGLPLQYVLYFYTPKFFNLRAFEKIKVIFHELYHISPKFNGDIRRMGKVKLAHGSSKKKFDSYFEAEAKIFFDQLATTEYMNILDMNSRALQKEYSVYARRMKIPKPVIISN